jgi:hypothetical protein
MFHMHMRACSAATLQNWAIIVAASGIDKAIVLRDMPDGRSAKKAVIDSALAQYFALKSWISCSVMGAYFTLSD